MEHLPYVEPLDAPPLALTPALLKDLMENGGILNGQPPADEKGRYHIGELDFNRGWVHQGVAIQPAAQDPNSDRFYALLIKNDCYYLRVQTPEQRFTGFGKIKGFGELPSDEMRSKILEDSQRTYNKRAEQGRVVHPVRLF